MNSITAVLMAFARYCQRHGWIDSVPPLNKLDVDDVMKGRPITTEEFERMLAATPAVVGEMSAPSWQFALRVLWESGFRVGDLMDFSWDDDRHIHPVWPRHSGQHPTIIVPPSQKNGRLQEIPMLPGLHQLLQSVSGDLRSGWVVNLAAVRLELESREAFRATSDDLQSFVQCYSNSSIARACGVSDAAVRNWLRQERIHRADEFHSATGEVPASKVAVLRRNALASAKWMQSHARPSVDHAGKIIAKIGKEARIVVQRADERTGQRERFASAHDLRRGCAQRLINAGISAESLKVIFRHRNFATTEKYYGASRSAQSAATEVAEKLNGADNSPSLVGGNKRSPSTECRGAFNAKVFTE